VLIYIYVIYIMGSNFIIIRYMFCREHDGNDETIQWKTKKYHTSDNKMAIVRAMVINATFNNISVISWR
jgi:hypothetical protein